MYRDRIPFLFCDAEYELTLQKAKRDGGGMMHLTYEGVMVKGGLVVHPEDV